MTPLIPQRLRPDRSFERIYERHAADVYRYALAILRNPSDAEDVTQTTFLNALRAFERGERPRAPRNWLIAIAHNVCRQRFRQSQRRVSEVPFEDSVSEAPTFGEDGPSAKDIQRALGALAFNQRTALVMRELEGRSYAEIAELLGVSVSAVETLIFRARTALREQLEESLTCHEAERAMSRQLDGRLERADRGPLRAHLRTCKDCATLARKQRAQRSAIKALALVPLPSSLTGLFGGGSTAAAGTAAAAGTVAAVGGTAAVTGGTAAAVGGTAAVTGGTAAAAAASGLAVKAAVVVAAGALVGGAGYQGVKHAPWAPGQAKKAERASTHAGGKSARSSQRKAVFGASRQGPSRGRGQGAAGARPKSGPAAGAGVERRAAKPATLRGVPAHRPELELSGQAGAARRAVRRPKRTGSKAARPVPPQRTAPRTERRVAPVSPKRAKQEAPRRKTSVPARRPPSSTVPEQRRSRPSPGTTPTVTVRRDPKHEASTLRSKPPKRRTVKE